MVRASSDVGSFNASRTAGSTGGSEGGGSDDRGLIRKLAGGGRGQRAAFLIGPLLGERMRSKHQGTYGNQALGHRLRSACIILTNIR